MRQRARNLIVFFFLAWGFVACSALLIVLVTGYVGLFRATAMLYGNIKYTRRWQGKTSPLPAETVEDLCAQFDLPPDERLCRPDAEVYAPEFNHRIRLIIFRRDGGSWSQGEVEAKLGAYKVGCDPPTASDDGTEYVRCTYDLRGDGVYPLTIYYTYADGIIDTVRYFIPID